MKKYKNIILILAAVAVTLAAFIFALRVWNTVEQMTLLKKPLALSKRTMSLGFHQSLSQQVRK